jgi:CRISP-associated protein Cas1
MSSLFITTQGAIIHRRSGQILVTKNRDILQNIPETHVKQLILFGNVNLTTPVIAFCLDRKIEVVFLTQGGKFQGRLNGEGGKSAQLRRKQYEQALNKQFCLTQARVIVSGKLQNMIAFARRQERSAKDEIYSLKRALASTERASSIETLLGIEGSASATYFRMLSCWIPQGWTFGGRTSHPPKDAVNALLSLGYTLIYNRVVSNLNLIGLDPYQGFYHTVRHGHAALASDLMENFRPVICDSLIMKLIRRNQIKPEQVIKEQGEFRMDKEASKVFFLEFDNKMNSRRNSSDDGDLNLSYTEIIKRQCYQFARVIAGEDPIYRPFTIK